MLRFFFKRNLLYVKSTYPKQLLSFYLFIFLVSLPEFSSVFTKNEFFLRFSCQLRHIFDYFIALKWEKNFCFIKILYFLFSLRKLLGKKTKKCFSFKVFFRLNLSCSDVYTFSLLFVQVIEPAVEGHKYFPFNEIFFIAVLSDLQIICVSFYSSFVLTYRDRN